VALRAGIDVDNLGAMARCLDLFAVLEQDEGAADRAALLLAAATVARERLAHARAPHEARATAELERVLRDGLPASRLRALRDDGAALPLRDAAALALGTLAPV
jgi:hypothetical protein